ncbi:MAG: hypothetical protein U0271_15000 [Polyangiaceae bacterium]
MEFVTFRNLGLVPGPDLYEQLGQLPERDGATVVAYLESGCVFMTCLGSVDDVISGATNIARDEFVTDGTWVWDACLSYYVTRYGVGLPPGFIDRMRARNWAAPRLTTEQKLLAVHDFRTQSRHEFVDGERAERVRPTLHVENSSAADRRELDELDLGWGCKLFEWATLISRLEANAYTGNEFDYGYALRQRDWVEGAVAKASSSLAGKLRAELAPLDERFRATSIEYADPSTMPAPYDETPTPYPGFPGWWWSRVSREWRYLDGWM